MTTDELLLPVAAIDRLRMGTDGNGIRTLICTCDCPLRCKYCLNPFTWNKAWNPTTFSVSELYQQLSIDRLYFQATGGGVTFGGGEPLLHAEFIKEYAAFCGSTWDFWVETCLHVPQEKIRRCMNVFSQFVVDIKSMNAAIYHAYTGGDLAVALANLKVVLAMRGPECVTVRVPQIPDYNDADDIRQSVQALKSLGVTQIDTFQYRIK